MAWRAAGLLVAAASVALIVGYSFVVPAFEAPDEPGHFRYVERLAAGGGLPVQGAAGDYDPEFSQPPLYYAVEALVVKVLPGAGTPVPAFARQNPYQNATPSGNANLYSHPASEGFPWTGQILQLHTMRLANVLFALATLASTYGIGRELGLKPVLAVAAGGVLGLLPQFDFISGALNADNAITAAAAAALYLLLRSWDRPPSRREGVLLGLVTGAAMLSKLSGLGVLALVTIALVWRAWREKKRGFLTEAAICAGVSLAAAGWWYGRNLASYGDPLGWQPMLTAIGAMLRPRALSPLGAAAALLRQAPTGLGVFGWDNLRLPWGVYIAAGIVAALAAAGLIRALRHLRDPRVGLLLAWIAIFGASLVRWVEVNTDAAQWRLLFPAFPALAVLLVLGLSRISRLLAGSAPAALAGLSAASLMLVVRPAYMADPAYSGPIQHQLNVLFGDRLELVGYDEPQPQHVAPGQPVAITLYWRARQPLPRDDSVDLAALDADGQRGLKESTWPQYGRAPTSGWQPGQIIRDRHTLVSSGRPLAPGAYTLFVDVFEPLRGAPRLRLPDGGTTFSLGRFLVLPPLAAAVPSAPASFGGSLALLDITSGSPRPGALEVTLDWLVRQPLGRDYTVFVHLLNAGGKVVSQSDGQPDGGRFPTSLLPAGIRVRDTHTLALPELQDSPYALEIGVYDVTTGRRLPVDGTDRDSFVKRIKLGS